MKAKYLLKCEDDLRKYPRMGIWFAVISGTGEEICRFLGTPRQAEEFLRRNSVKLLSPLEYYALICKNKTDIGEPPMRGTPTRKSGRN